MVSQEQAFNVWYISSEDPHKGRVEVMVYAHYQLLPHCRMDKSKSCGSKCRRRNARQVAVSCRLSVQKQAIPWEMRKNFKPAS